MSVPDSTSDGYPLSDLNSFRRDVLRVVDDHGAPHGLAVRDTLEAAYDEDEISNGRVYPALDELVEKGLVEKSHPDKRTNEYTITARGRRELDAHRTWFAAGGEDGR